MRMLVVEDHPLVRRSLRELCQATFPDAIVETVSGPEELGSPARRGVAYDLALIDLFYGGEARGLGLLEPLVESGCAVVVLSNVEAPAVVARALAAGIRGYLPKTASEAEIAGALGRALEGASVTPRRLGDPARRVAGRTDERDRAIISGIAAGRTNKELATDLRYAPKTIESLLARLFERFGVDSRAALVAVALREGEIDPPPG